MIHDLLIQLFWIKNILWSCDFDLDDSCDRMILIQVIFVIQIKKTRDPVIPKWIKHMILWSQNEDIAWSCDLKMKTMHDPVIWELIIFVILWSHNEANSWSRDLRINNFCDLMIWKWSKLMIPWSQKQEITYICSAKDILFSSPADSQYTRIVRL